MVYLVKIHSNEMNYSFGQFFQKHPDRGWPPDIVFLHKVAHTRIYCDIPFDDADRVLWLADKPEFFVFEEEDDERRATAMHVLKLLLCRMPPDWCETARAMLEDCARDDSERCKELAQEALSTLEWHNRWYCRLLRSFF
jgi:hypothetical protein